MAFITKATRIIYKIFPSASSANPDTIFSTADGWAKITTSSYSHSFLNFPEDFRQGGGFNTLAGSIIRYPTTRVTSSTYPTTSVAFPWGSMAGDFLWNCLTPSWSYNTAGGRHVWSYTQVSESFNYRNNKQGSSFGQRFYSVTSSWETYNYKLYASASNTPATFSFLSGQASTFPTPDISNYTYKLEYPTGEFSPTENVFFDQSGGIGITRANVSRSMVSQSLQEDSSAKFAGLKRRRLYFPVNYTNAGQTSGTDYWLKKYSGFTADDFFDENGGIYNVSFTLRRSTYTDMFPDDESFLSVFIYNVKTNPGVAAFYPPATNIIKIGNNISSQGIPAISFNDPTTGELQTKFNINVIQYGFPAQLCFEASGSLASDKYFGIIIDDISVCKIGVTTDPRFIEPTTVGGTLGGGVIADGDGGAIT